MGSRISAAVFVWLGLFLGLSTAAHAQSSIAGVVKDASGAVLPGVTVEVSSPALIERTRTANSDGQGQYTIIALPPRYSAASDMAASLSAAGRSPW